MKRYTHSFICHLPRYVVIGMIVIYQRGLSPIKNALFGPGGCCRFYPTCSEYGIQSIRTHGVGKGIFLSLFRLSKCQPFHPGGFDPVKPVTLHFQTLPEPESLLDLPDKS